MHQNADNSPTVAETESPPAEPVDVKTSDDNDSDDTDTTGNPTAKAVVQLAFAALLIVAGVVLSYLLFSQKTNPATTNDLDARPVVETIIAEVGAQPVTIRGFGTVRARDRVQIVPQVDGQVVSTHPNFAEGGTIRGGETIATLDPADAELAVARADAEIDRLTATLKRLDASRKRAESAVAAAQTRLDTERAEAAVARAQFEKLKPGVDVPPLVAREPQLREAEANLAAAQADLEDVGSEREQIEAQLASARTALRQAELDLTRTDIKLPGESADRYRVLTKSAEVGQYVAPGTTVATLYKVSTLEVPVPLPADELQWFQLGEATAELTTNGIARTWTGTVVRTDGQIDPRSRLVNVVVAIAPEELDGQLVPGLFLETTIIGDPVENVAAVPRLALRQAERNPLADANTDTDANAETNGRNQATRRTGGFGTTEPQRLYVIREGLLRFVDVDVIRKTRETAFVRGLDNGDQVVTTDLSIVTDGMEVDVAGTETSAGTATSDELGVMSDE